jgi:hypothetical protein
VSFLLAGLAAMALLALTACGPTGPTWVDAGATYHTTNLKSLYAKASIGDLAKTSTADTAKLRHDALVGLRRRGGSAADAADLITKTLPADSHGVPLYVERANVNGVPALILIEAIGPSTGKLTTRRLWALSDQGAVLFVGTR